MNDQKKDPYISYIHRFFNMWAPVYDLFGLFILPVYRQTVRHCGELKEKNVIDVCTGTGEIAIRLAKEGADVTAIDITQSMIERAKRKAVKLPIKFIEADARALPFADKSFDISVISLGLHDMPRPVRLDVLREMARVTKEKIIVSEYYFPSNSLYQRLLIKFISLFETSYFVRFSEEGALGLIEESGLGQVKSYPVRFFCFSIYVVDLVQIANAK